MPRIDIEPKNINALDPTPRSIVSITGDLHILTLKPDARVPDRHVAAFFTEGTNALDQNLHVLLDGRSGNNIIVEADERGKVIVDKTPVDLIVFSEVFNTQVKLPYITPADPDA